MKEQSIVHIKVDYEEAIQSKRDLLTTERDFLNIIRRIKRYNVLRSEELNNKIKIQNKLKELNSNLNKINQIFPKIKLPDILKKKEIIKKNEEEEEKQEIAKAKEENKGDDLENQLMEIQEKLRRLGQTIFLKVNCFLNYYDKQGTINKKVYRIFHI